MKPHIENGEELLAAYITQKEQDYQKFAADLKALKKTLILSSHIFSSLVEICDEIFLLKNGKIIKKVTQKDFSNLASELKEFTIGNRIEKLGLS
jgi:ABC-type multidrug transport system ATPase subunit